MHTYDPDPPVDDDIEDNFGGFRQTTALCAGPDDMIDEDPHDGDPPPPNIYY